MASNQLAGKVAVVTGGGRGLGRGACLEMARAGAQIVVADIFRDESGKSAAESVVEEIEQLGGKAVASYENVVSPHGAEAIVTAAIESFGSVDILCTFAGNAVMKRILDVTDEDFDSSLKVHLYGTFNCIKAVVPHLLEQKSGRIITVSSRAAMQSPAPAYSAAKAGIMGLTAAVAMEMAIGQTGVTANCLLPSAVTQLFPSTGPRPLGGMPTPLSNDPDDVAPVVAFLASDAASSVNGRFVYAAGGDVCVYALPFEVASANAILRKHGRWTLDELAPLMVPVAGTTGATGSNPT
jgi:3-oxoacyl-[acyl-carrier protein] reductase